MTSLPKQWPTCSPLLVSFRDPFMNMSSSKVIFITVFPCPKLKHIWKNSISLLLHWFDLLHFGVVFFYYFKCSNLYFLNCIVIAQHQAVHILKLTVHHGTCYKQFSAQCVFITAPLICYHAISWKWKLFFPDLYYVICITAKSRASSRPIQNADQPSHSRLRKVTYIM